MLEYILPPVIGGVIGCITNDLAIRMLFHPRKPIYIGKWHVPFTPGLIVQQKGRIAKAIGSVVGRQLLSADAIRELALSEETVAHLEQSMRAALCRAAQEEASFRELLGENFSAQSIDGCTARVCEEGTRLLSDRLLSGQMSRAISMEVTRGMQERMRGTFLGRMMDDTVMETLQESMAGIIQRKMEEKAPEMISSELTRAAKQLLDTPVCDLAAPYAARIDELTHLIVQAYRGVLGSHLEKVLEKVDVAAIVEAKVNSFSAEQMEGLIFGMMKRELKAIVWLGGLLGFLMGFVNLLL